MPFDNSKLKATREGLWEYTTLDQSSIVLAPGYFSSESIKQDHVLVIDCSNRKNIVAAANASPAGLHLNILCHGQVA